MSREKGHVVHTVASEAKSDCRRGISKALMLCIDDTTDPELRTALSANARLRNTVSVKNIELSASTTSARRGDGTLQKGKYYVCVSTKTTTPPGEEKTSIKEPRTLRFERC